jgi:Uma2 family endonuclease
MALMKAARVRTDKGITLKEWGELPEEVCAELVDGVLVEDEMTTGAHDVLMSYLAHFFSSWVLPHGGRVLFERKFGISRNRGRKPDVSVFLPGTRGFVLSERVTTAPPDIAIEIITPTPRDIRRDRVEKRRDYAKLGVRWYWIVDPTLETVEILELGKSGRYEHLADGATGRLRVPGCRGRALDLDALWRQQKQ